MKIYQRHKSINHLHPREHLLDILNIMAEVVQLFSNNIVSDCLKKQCQKKLLNVSTVVNISDKAKIAKITPSASIVYQFLVFFLQILNFYISTGVITSDPASLSCILGVRHHFCATDATECSSKERQPCLQYICSKRFCKTFIIKF